MSAYCLFGLFTTGFSFVSVIVLFASVTYLLQFGQNEFREAPGGCLTIIIWTIVVQLLSSIVFIIFMEYDPCLFYIKDNLETCQNDGLCCDCFDEASETCNRSCSRCGSLCQSLKRKVVVLGFYFILLAGFLIFLKRIANSIYEERDFVDKLEPLT